MSTYQNILGVMYAYDAEIPSLEEIQQEVLSKSIVAKDAFARWEFFNKYSTEKNTYKDFLTKRDFVFTELLEGTDPLSFVYFHLWAKLHLTKIKVALNMHSSFPPFLEELEHNKIGQHLLVETIETHWDELCLLKAREKETLIDGFIFEGYRSFLTTADETEKAFIQAYLYELAINAVSRSSSDIRYETYLIENENLNLKSREDYMSLALFSEMPAAQILVFIERLDVICKIASLCLNINKNDVSKILKEN